jgi:hypothetical protein
MSRIYLGLYLDVFSYIYICIYIYKSCDTYIYFKTEEMKYKVLVAHNKVCNFLSQKIKQTTLLALFSKRAKCPSFSPTIFEGIRTFPELYTCRDTSRFC